MPFACGSVCGDVRPVGAADHGTVPAPPGTTHYDVVDLGTLGGTSSTPNGINDRGLVTGSSFLQGDKVQHAILWTRGRKVDLGTLGGPNSAVNWAVKADTGEIAGVSQLSKIDPFAERFCSSFRTTHLCLGFRYQRGVMTPLPTLGGNNGYATSVNDRGQVVGLAETANQDSSCVAPQVFDYDAVMWGPNGRTHVLHPLAGDTVSEAIAINSAGQVVGASGPCGPTLNPAYAAHALLWQNESIIDLGNLGCSIFNAATAINDRGQIAGISGLPGNTALHGFLWQNGVMSDLGTLPGDVNSFAFGINNNGQVVGASCPARGHCHAVLWQNGTITDLSLLVPSRLHMFEAFDINDGGQIVASGDSLTGGRTPAVLLIPDDGALVAPPRGSTRKVMLPPTAATRGPSPPRMHAFATSCLTAACIYVANPGGSVTVYSASANGNVAPVQTISGSATRLMNAFGVGVDSGRNIYATSFISYFIHFGRVLVYAAGANGNVAPIRDIGPAGLVGNYGIALGPNDGTFVTNAQAGPGDVTVYPPGANGNVPPVQSIRGSKTRLNGPWGIALGPHGGIYVANTGNFSVTVYSPGANGDVPPVQTISGSKTGLSLPKGVALGANGAIYVANSQANSVTVYALGANGNVAPVRTISGSNTGLNSPAGIALGSNGAVYVANTGNSSLTVYPPGANGNIRPVQTISGSNTGLNQPEGIALR